ncbi:response regulator transcription factor [Acidihalobacter ferrooxydans]|uniref:DNA-binding response regulator n=1 Tax=Acidihalobacter ferrooxydans TaxID=1765967 RepID=A0A1P8UL93_9GAMM|nr:response regulator transcription factor [Acidihalobacter ferrooxydans]APZ44600.1 DNA-binding response regulator [Acidihalobacter ferrooxydans]
MNILLVEDDREAAAYLVKGLTQSGHVVEHADNGPDGLHLALTGTYDALILDRMLPGLDGLSLLSALRAANNATPVLFLSALGEVDDRVAGLRAGGDDYLVKPYAFSELVARLEGLDRRVRQEPANARLQIADLVFDRDRHRVTRAGRTIRLQPREMRLLEYLMRNAGKVVTRTMLLEQVWDYHFDPQTNVIDVHISRLRAKIDRDFTPSLLHTVRGAGYRLGIAEE